VLDLGCAGGYVAALLRRQRGCWVTGVDCVPLGPGIDLDRFIRHDLNDGIPRLDVTHFEYVLLLDVIEHLLSPERFVGELRKALTPHTKVLASTGNIGFFVNRFMLLGGQFNYGKRGILDLTHTRLFTLASFRQLFEQNGFRILSTRAVPAPLALVFGSSRLSLFLTAVNGWLARLAPRLFAYQLFFVVEPLPSLEYLLGAAYADSERRGGSESNRAMTR
jgi:SAM-dependent methyltransferase